MALTEILGFALFGRFVPSLSLVLKWLYIIRMLMSKLSGRGGSHEQAHALARFMCL